jgi:hypothetical protein
VRRKAAPDYHRAAFDKKLIKNPIGAPSVSRVLKSFLTNATEILRFSRYNQDVSCGWPPPGHRPTPDLRRALRRPGARKVRAAELAPVIRDLQAKGYSLRGMAAELTKRKVPTPRGGRWSAQTVKMVVGRLAS